MDRFRSVAALTATLVVAGCTDPGINGRVEGVFTSLFGSPPSPPTPVYTANPEPIPPPNQRPGYAPAYPPYSPQS